MAAAARNGQSGPRGRGGAFVLADLRDGRAAAGPDRSLRRDRVDAERRTATILGGTRIHQIGEPLFEAGLAVANQGDIDVQAIAGAIGTGTHGTGRAFGSFSSTLVGCQIVTATGDLLTVDESDLETLRAARVSLGTARRDGLGDAPGGPGLQAAPAELAGRMERGADAMAGDRSGFAQSRVLVDSAARYVSIQGRSSRPTKSRPARLRADSIPAGHDRAVPAAGRSRLGVAGLPSRPRAPLRRDGVHVRDRSWMDAFAAVRELMLARHPEVKWAVEFRTHAAEDAFLSVTQGEDSITISVHDAAENAHWEFFREAEQVFREFDGRPHWGKLNFLEPDELKRSSRSSTASSPSAAA